MGVGPKGGRVILAQEVEEAKLFIDAAQLDGPSLPAAVRGHADTALRALRAMVDRTAPPDSVSLRAALLVQRIAASVGGPLDPFPVRPVALARGAAVYREQCTQCHGPAGRGDGPKAKGLVGPPPSDLSARADLASVSPVDMYRKIAIGIEGTGMPEYAHSLSSDDRWAVTTYVGTFRANPGTVLEGEGLYATQCASCHGASGRGDGTLARTLSVSPPALADLAVQGRLSDDDLTQLILGGRAGTPMPGFARVLDRAAAEKVVAFLRVLPAQERQQGQPSAGSMVFNDVRRQLDSAVALRSPKRRSPRISPLSRSRPKSALAMRRWRARSRPGLARCAAAPPRALLAPRWTPSTRDCSLGSSAPSGWWPTRCRPPSCSWNPSY